MSDTDNVISSRDIRLGNHTRLPFSVYCEMCLSLHEQIGWRVYDGSDVTCRPVLGCRAKERDNALRGVFFSSREPIIFRELNGARGRNRTTDTRIFNPLLYP